MPVMQKTTIIAPNGILPIRAGLIMLGVASGAACFLYLGGLFAVGRGRRTPSQVIASRVWTAKRYERMRARLPDRMGAALPQPASEGQPPAEGAAEPS